VVTVQVRDWLNDQRHENIFPSSYVLHLIMFRTRIQQKDRTYSYRTPLLGQLDSNAVPGDLKFDYEREVLHTMCIAPSSCSLSQTMSCSQCSAGYYVIPHDLLLRSSKLQNGREFSKSTCVRLCVHKHPKMEGNNASPPSSSTSSHASMFCLQQPTVLLAGSGLNVEFLHHLLWYMSW